jgi:hypothetical protein
MNFSCNIFEEMAKVLSIMEESKTFNSLLVHEVMQKSTEHFERVDSHYSSEGVLAKYKCNVDGRTYSVKVSADKV